jgi:signal transduction histidine kinase
MIGTFADRQLRLEVRDDGRGLRNMESRAARLGGALRRENAEPSSCVVSLALPL